MAKNSLKYAGNLTLNAAIFELPVFFEAKKLVMENVGPLTTQIGRVCYPHQSNFYGIWYMVYGIWFLFFWQQQSVSLWLPLPRRQRYICH